MSMSLFKFKTLKMFLAAAGIVLANSQVVNATIICDEDGADATNCELPIYEWSDSTKRLNGIVVTIHGATQQASSFDVLARQLAQSGFLVCSVDLRGHGKWHYKPLQFKGGYTVDYKQSVLDLEHLLSVLKKGHPDLPIYAIGESCGAAVLVKAAAKDPAILQGIVLASVGTHPRHFKADWILPDVIRSVKHLGAPLQVARYIKRYSSDDPRVPKEMVDDPMARSSMNVKELIATALFIHTTPDSVKKLPEKMPLLMLQGTEDNVCSPTSVKQIVRRKLGDDKQLIYMADCGHVLLGTKYIKPQVSKIVVGWLNKHKDMAIADNAGPVALNHTNSIQASVHSQLVAGEL